MLQWLISAPLLHFIYNYFILLTQIPSYTVTLVTCQEGETCEIIDRSSQAQYRDGTSHNNQYSAITAVGLIIHSFPTKNCGNVSHCGPIITFWCETGLIFLFQWNVNFLLTGLSVEIIYQLRRNMTTGSLTKAPFQSLMTVFLNHRYGAC